MRLTTLGQRGGGAASRTAGAATGMNMTKLISHWSMSGARRDVGGRFRATDDIVAVIAGNQPAPEPTAAGSSFLVKASDEEGWQPLGQTTGGRV